MRVQKRIVLSWFLYAILVLTHIPVSIAPNLFDKNIAPQFITLNLISTIYAIFIFVKAENYLANKYLFLATAALLIAVIASAFLSNNVISAFTGDTGRYAGVATLICLILVSAYHLNITKDNFLILLRLYLIMPVIQSILGIMQHYEILDFPGANGFSATLGNEDFFAAYVGVSAPLFILAAIQANKSLRFSLLIGYLICIYALYEAGPLQAYVDLALTILGLLIYKFRKLLPSTAFSLNIRNAIGTLLIVIWSQVIFLTPFLGSWIPTLGNDLQVKIRGNFWLAGMRQFFEKPIFGVGPDQYGNYYEQFRTITDAQTYTQILSNDAHSASVQTLATLGLLGTIAFLVLISILIRAILVLWDSERIPRINTFLLSLFFFVYLTNAFVSPMTFPAKFLFWAVAGWVIGQVYLKQNIRNQISKTQLKLLSGVLALVILFIGGNFTLAQLRYATAYESFIKNPNSKINYTFNPYIPCFMYFDGQFKMLNSQGLDQLKVLAQTQIHENPRCVAAHLVLAQVAKAQNDLPSYKNEIYRLVEIAPARSQVLNLALEYANTYKDYKLLNRLKQIIKELNLLYVPGAAG